MEKIFQGVSEANDSLIDSAIGVFTQSLTGEANGSNNIIERLPCYFIPLDNISGPQNFFQCLLWFSPLFKISFSLDKVLFLEEILKTCKPY